MLQNPGNISRFYLEGLIAGARSIGLACDTFELGPFWQLAPEQMMEALPGLAEKIQNDNVGAILSYAWNGVMGFPTISTNDNSNVSFIEALGIPNLLLWTDHPQFFNNCEALGRDIQPLLSAPNNWHFLKNTAATGEIKQMLHWPNCSAMNMAEDPAQWKPMRHIKPECDIVVIGLQWPVDQELTAFLDKPDPGIEEIQKIFAAKVTAGLAETWQSVTDPGMRSKLTAMGKDWIERRVQDQMHDPFRHLSSMEKEHGDAVAWLQHNPDMYFRAARQFWTFGKWQRPFYLEYLARRFNLRWTGTSGQSVQYSKQSEVYALGRIAVNIPQAHDMEGLSHKPFQIAASQVAMAHLNCIGLSDCFQPGTEVETFNSPAEACDTVSMLLKDSEHREAIAAAARRRVETEHNWANRLHQMFNAAGLNINHFLN